MSKKISSEAKVSDGGENRLTGYSIVKATDMDTALETAKACPFLEMGILEVAVVMQM